MINKESEIYPYSPPVQTRSPSLSSLTPLATITITIIVTITITNIIIIIKILTENLVVRLNKWTPTIVRHGRTSQDQRRSRTSTIWPTLCYIYHIQYTIYYISDTMYYILYYSIHFELYMGWLAKIRAGVASYQYDRPYIICYTTCTCIYDIHISYI